MKLLNWFCIVFFSIGAISCNESAYKRFINKYSTENFSPYMNKGIVIREHDNNDHSLILFIDINVSGARNDGPYIIKVNKESGKIIGASTHLMADTSYLKGFLLQTLALKFLTYDINSLKVDLKGNVFVGIENDERPDLIRFATETNMTGFNRNDWIKMKDNWYKRK